MYDWFARNLEQLRQLSWRATFVLSLVVFLVSFVVSLALAIWVLVQLPHNYFQVNHPRALFLAEQHPLLRWAGLITKNLVGLALVALGIVLSLPGVPGQGILTILIGVMLLNFPGKRRLEQKLVSRPAVFRTINRLRARFGKPPLVLEDEREHNDG